MELEITLFFYIVLAILCPEVIITLLNNDNNALYLSVKSSRSGALRSDTSRGLVALSVKTSTKAGRSDQALIRCTRSDFR